MRRPPHSNRPLLTALGLSLATLLPMMILLSGSLLPASVAARVYACESDNGTVFQDAPCAAKAPPNPSTSTSSRLHTQTSGAPVIIDESWFESPTIDSLPLYCDQYGCQCGTEYRSFHGGLNQAVADALYIDGSWHRLESQLAELATMARYGTAYTIATLKAEQTACLIRMSQRTIELFGERVRQRLERAARRAEEAGITTSTVCKENDTACHAHQAAIDRWQQFSADLQNLAFPREDLMLLQSFEDQ